MTKIMISAGEVSGDLHAGAVTKAIKQFDPQAEVFGMGGDYMREAGAEVLFDIKNHSVMGFAEVLKNLSKLWTLRKDFIKVMEERKPDCLITIDYPGFNMRLARLAKERNIPVLSFIPPSVWAWGEYRAKNVVKSVDKIASIFPFEADLYKKYGADVTFVGHPLADSVKFKLSDEEAREKAGKNSKDRPLVLLMPGSRYMEVNKLLTPMLQGAYLMKENYPALEFALLKSPNIAQKTYDRYLSQVQLRVKQVEGDNYDVMRVADLAIATSGTVTLEAAMCGLGSVILYKTSSLNYSIAKNVVNIPFIGLPNIVAGKEILPELIQEKCDAFNICDEALFLLKPNRNRRMKAELAMVKEKVGKPGATKRVALMALQMANMAKYQDLVIDQEEPEANNKIEETL